MARPKRTVDPTTGVTFVALPGGTLEVGLRADERAVVERLVGDGPPVRWPKARTVKVAPFRVATGPLSPEVVGPITTAYESYGSDAAHVTAEDAAKVVGALGYRLLTDAEWEYVARSGGAGSWVAPPGPRIGRAPRNTFGIEGLGWGTWLAPTRGKRPSKTTAGGLRSRPWQSRAEAVTVHAAYRDAGGRAPLLVAWNGTSTSRASPPPAAWDGDRHVATGLRFVDVPGGTFEMGLGPAERARLERLLPPEHHALFATIAARCPPRTVTVAPFRVATTPLTEEASLRLGGPTGLWSGFATNPPEVVAKWAKRFGFRLLTEAEWEYLARDGGERGWGADLEAVLARLPDPDVPPPPYTNRYGVDYAAGSLVDDGTLVRATVDRDHGYPHEVDDYLPRFWLRSDDWMPVLFAVAEP